MHLGFLGLGKMGSRMAGKLARGGHSVAVWNRSPEPAQILHNEIPQITVVASPAELIHRLGSPIILWLMLPAGDVTEKILQEIFPLLKKGDIVIDGGNSHFSDTHRRFEMAAAKNIRYLGIGVSGGIIASTQGYPLMVGGDQSAYIEIKPILDTLAEPHGGHEYFGTGGAGHFVKMVHNGIEYGIMQSLGEGYGVLAKSSYNLDLLKVTKLWQKGTLVSGFMLDRTLEALEPDPKLNSVVGSITELGEATWTITEAKKLDLPIEIIEKSLDFRHRSQTDLTIQQSFAAKLVAALRNAFGGHAVKSTLK